MATTVLLNSTSMSASFGNPTAPYHSTTDASCPQCGYHLPALSDPSTEAAEATRRIRDLEAQVRLLNSKAAAAVDKLADYEDEIRYLKDVYAQSHQQQGHGRSPSGGTTSSPLEGPRPTIAPSTPGQSLQPQQQSRLASLSSFLPGRRKEVRYGRTATPFDARSRHIPAEQRRLQFQHALSAQNTLLQHRRWIQPLGAGSPNRDTEQYYSLVPTILTRRRTQPPYTRRVKLVSNTD